VRPPLYSSISAATARKRIRKEKVAKTISKELFSFLIRVLFLFNEKHGIVLGVIDLNARARWESDKVAFFVKRRNLKEVF